MDASPTPNPEPGAPAPRPSSASAPGSHTPLQGDALLGAPAPASSGAAGAPVAAPPRTGGRGSRHRGLTVLAAIFLLVGSAFVGFGARDGWFTRDTSSSIAAPAANSQAVDNSSTTPSGGTDFGQVADDVDGAIVNITSSTSQGIGAGTGMIISSKGLVLTNHHVISGADQLEVEVGGNGKTYDAHVVGYSIADDVALVQIEDVSGLPTIDTDDSVSQNEDVLVMGNALGRGGEPTVATGRVVALGQQITASDGSGYDTETLTGMIQIAASVQPGQSGGAVVDADGEVVGMTTAASVGGGFRFDQTANEAYAIPIARAIAAAQQIQKGSSNDAVHVGPRGVMGVTVPARAPSQSGSANGVTVSGVESGGPADDAGITVGSTIVGINDTTIRNQDDITAALNPYGPDDEVKVTWLDGSGSRHTATVQLVEGPPA